MTSILAFMILLAAPQATQATISGITRRADNGLPLANVTITLTSLNSVVAPTVSSPGGLPTISSTTPRAPLVRLEVRSDGAGRFAFSGIPPGPYTMSATHEGFSRLQYRWISGRNPQVYGNIAAGQNLVGLILALDAMSLPSISGVVYGADGKRVAAASVQAYRVRYTPFGHELIRVASVLTHEAGEYRLFDLPLGPYVFSASYSEQTIQPWKSRVEFTPNLPNPDEGYAPIYFPESTNIPEAKIIRLSGSGETTGFDIRFKESEYFKLTIQLLPPVSGRSLKNAMVSLYPPGSDIGSAVDYRIRRTGSNFTADHLARGDYMVVALDEFLNPDGQTVTKIISNPKLIHLTENTEEAIGTADPFNITGTVNVTGGTLPAVIKLQLIRTDRAAAQTFSTEIAAIPLSTGAEFELQDVEPGAYDVVLVGIPRTAYVGDAGFARDEERQLARIHVDAAAPERMLDGGKWKSVQKLDVSLNLDGTTANGTVVSPKDRKPLSGSKVVLVPVDPIARLRIDRYFATYSVSDPPGTFQFQGVPPGTYHAYASVALESNIYFDAEFDRQLAPKAVEYRGGADQINLIDISGDEIVSRMFP